MIKIQTVTKTFDEVRSLNRVDLAIENGSIFGLIGSNGSGKTTLLKLLCGVYSPDEGTISYDGVPVWENPAVKQQMVYLSDDQYFLPHCTMQDMMRLYASIYPSFSREKYEEYRDLFGLDERRKIATFSKGMQKQVSVLLGLACRTQYLFCDETMDGLDPVMRQTVRKILAAEVADRGVTVVFASHNLRELEDICDRVALLHKGELLFEAGLDDVRTGMHKIQLSFPRDRLEEAKTALEAMQPLSLEQRGSLFTMTMRGQEDELDRNIRTLHPLFAEFIPLTLEEIFIVEMEERGYEFHEQFID